MDFDLINPVMDDDELDPLNLIIHGISRRINIFPKISHVQGNNSISIGAKIEADLEFPYNINQNVSPINQLLSIFVKLCHRKIIGRVSRAIASLYRQHIQFPTTDEDNQTKFFEVARFPRVVGVVDCTHIRIQSPGKDDAHIFRNRKCHFSINVQMICNSNLEALNMFLDGPVLVTMRLFSIIVQFDKNLRATGDSGYFLKPYLLTLLLNPATPGEQLYINQSHIRTRNIVECYFGVIKRRFPVLAYGCRLKLETVLVVIVACNVLHNICRRQNEEEPPLHGNQEKFLQHALIENYFANL
ncbi:hypothetical protein NQ315_017513 [Exocentrus adspersus]|uniref:DDE Tnp4 domain-containing protein n=1 Tax=Exocentrus adspersus TaxID=1586481 RepID=A0AAV8VJT4_9CUCU|nr:hypothetical protein NQ315_017513 [Exocentrus adspersus]